MIVTVELKVLDTGDWRDWFFEEKHERLTNTVDGWISINGKKFTRFDFPTEFIKYQILVTLEEIDFHICRIDIESKAFKIFDYYHSYRENDKVRIFPRGQKYTDLSAPHVSKAFIKYTANADARFPNPKDHVLSGCQHILNNATLTNINL